MSPLIFRRQLFADSILREIVPAEPADRLRIVIVIPFDHSFHRVCKPRGIFRLHGKAGLGPYKSFPRAGFVMIIGSPQPMASTNTMPNVSYRLGRTNA